MSEIVGKINSIIKEEKIETLCGDMYIDYIIQAKEIDNSLKIEESFKKYIIENDSINKSNINLNDYIIEEVDNVEKDIYSIIENNRTGLCDIRDKTEDVNKINRFIQILKENKAKGFKLINENNNKEYILEDAILGGEIRCYETSDARFIVSFEGYD